MLLVTGKSAAAAQAIAVVVFALIGFSLVIIPFVFLVVRPAGTEAQLQHAEHWLKSHARQILAAAVLLVGACMVVKRPGAAELSHPGTRRHRDDETSGEAVSDAHAGHAINVPLAVVREIRSAGGWALAPSGCPRSRKHPPQGAGTVVPQARRQGRLLTPSDGMRYAAARGSAISDPLTSRLRWLWR